LKSENETELADVLGNLHSIIDIYKAREVASIVAYVCFVIEIQVHEIMRKLDDEIKTRNAPLRATL